MYIMNWDLTPAFKLGHRVTTCHQLRQKPVRILQKSPEEKAKEKAEPDPGNLGKILR